MPATGFPDVKAGQACSGAASAARVESAAVFASTTADEVVEFRFEDGLQSAEYEVAARGGVDEESQVQRDQVFGECIPVDSRVHAQSGG